MIRGTHVRITRYLCSVTQVICLLTLGSSILGCSGSEIVDGHDQQQPSQGRHESDSREVLLVEPPLYEPVFRVNGQELSPLYAEWNSPSDDPVMDDVHALQGSDSIQVSLEDHANTYRIIEFWIFDQIPTKDTVKIAEVACDNFGADELRLFDNLNRKEVDDASESISILSCAMSDTGAELTLDLTSLAEQYASRLYIVVPIIWWPTDSGYWKSEDWRTASWAFSVAHSIDRPAGVSSGKSG